MQWVPYLPTPANDQPLNLQPIWGCMYKYIMGQTELQKKKEKDFKLFQSNDF